jgi:phage regulator Rha-like protein
MSCLEIGAMAAGGISFILTVAKTIFDCRSEKAHTKQHVSLMESIEEIKQNLTPVDVDKTNTPENNPYEVVDEDQYREMKPYYNVKTQKTEYFIEAPYTERNHRIVPKLNI